jgi:hypothetical protein
LLLVTDDSATSKGVKGREIGGGERDEEMGVEQRKKEKDRVERRRDWEERDKGKQVSTPTYTTNIL